MSKRRNAGTEAKSIPAESRLFLAPEFGIEFSFSYHALFLPEAPISFLSHLEQIDNAVIDAGFHFLDSKEVKRFEGQDAEILQYCDFSFYHMKRFIDAVKGLIYGPLFLPEWFTGFRLFRNGRAFDFSFHCFGCPFCNVANLCYSITRETDDKPHSG
jgi:hypothetical protein